MNPGQIALLGDITSWCFVWGHVVVLGSFSCIFFTVGLLRRGHEAHRHRPPPEGRARCAHRRGFPAAAGGSGGFLLLEQPRKTRKKNNSTLPPACFIKEPLWRTFRLRGNRFFMRELMTYIYGSINVTCETFKANIKHLECLFNTVKLFFQK